jgi:hypothetical protein
MRMAFSVHTDLKKLGHDLPKIWEKFKTTFNDPALDKFDDTITALERFEDIRYPDLIVQKGLLATININKQLAIPATGPEPTYELCVNDIDELVGQVFATTSANPPAFLIRRLGKEEARKHLLEHNPVTSLTTPPQP